MPIDSIDMRKLHTAVDELLGYVHHVLAMQSPPSTVPIPTKLLRELNHSVRRTHVEKESEE